MPAGPLAVGLDCLARAHLAPSSLQEIAGFQGYRSPLYRRLLFALLCVLSAGVLFVLSRWHLRLRVVLTMVPCALGVADYVVVTVCAAAVLDRGVGVCCQASLLDLQLLVLPGQCSRPVFCRRLLLACLCLQLRPFCCCSASKPEEGFTFPTCPRPVSQTVDKQQELAHVHKLASFNSINIQASSVVVPATHVLAEDETPVATPTALADVTAALKGGDGYDRLLEFRCGRYLYHHGQATFLPVPAMPDDFPASLRCVAGSRNIKGGCRLHWRCGVAGQCMGV